MEQEGLDYVTRCQVGQLTGIGDREGDRRVESSTHSCGMDEGIVGEGDVIRHNFSDVSRTSNGFAVCSPF